MSKRRSSSCGERNKFFNRLFIFLCYIFEDYWDKIYFLDIIGWVVGLFLWFE